MSSLAPSLLFFFSAWCTFLPAQLIVKFRTAQLEHEFGCPYQLGHHRHANHTSDADLAALPVTVGDVIVMGSDGLLDNMSEVEVVSEVSKLVAAGARPGAMAQRIAKVGDGYWLAGDSRCQRVTVFAWMGGLAGASSWSCVFTHTCASLFHL